MGLIDQRGEWRRVVAEGDRQGQAQEPGHDATFKFTQLVRRPDSTDPLVIEFWLARP